MKNKKIVVFTKEKPGLRDVLDFLNDEFSSVEVYKGVVGDVFPNKCLKNNYDICISYMSPWIIPNKMLTQIKEFSLNFHPGPPEYRGIGCTNFALYNNDSKYGVTVHQMTDKVDSGKIIAVKRFPILTTDSLIDLTQKCYSHILELFYNVFDYYLRNGCLPETREAWSRRLFTRNELDELCRVDANMSKEEVSRRIKATNFPNMPGAFMTLHGFRFEHKE